MIHSLTDQPQNNRVVRYTWLYCLGTSTAASRGSVRRTAPPVVEWFLATVRGCQPTRSTTVVSFQHDGAPSHPVGEVPNWLDGLGAGEKRNGHQDLRNSRPKISFPIASSEVTGVQ